MSHVHHAPPEGFHSAAARLAEALHEAVRASLDLEGDLYDHALDGVTGGLAPGDVYGASAGFLADWQTDEPPLA